MKHTLSPVNHSYHGSLFVRISIISNSILHRDLSITDEDEDKRILYVTSFCDTILWLCLRKIVYVYKEMDEDTYSSYLKSKPKRPRGANFTPLDKKLLRSLFVRFRSILELKHLNLTTIHKKDQVWNKITEIFNARSISGVYRDKLSLKTFQENDKRRFRRMKNAQQKKLNDADNVAAEEENAANPEDMYPGFDNPYDSDALYKETSNHDTETDQVVVKLESVSIQ